jgi:hypothetical protein
MWDPSGRVVAPSRRPSSAGSGLAGQQPPAPPQGRKFHFTGIHNTGALLLMHPEVQWVSFLALQAEHAMWSGAKSGM